jgi:16S rRNA (guanine1207-N2)-methyltransferase
MVETMSNHYFSDEPTSKLERGLIKTVLRGRKYTFVTATGLFSYKKIDNGTRLLVESMEIPEKGCFLDIGCGIGVIGIVAARECPELRVTMTDINPRATLVATENVDRFKLENVEVDNGNLYEPVSGRKFHTIVSNPPISAGMKKVIEPLVRGSVDHLVHGGSIQLVVQSNTGCNTLTRFLGEYLGECQTVGKGSGYRVLVAHKA